APVSGPDAAIARVADDVSRIPRISRPTSAAISPSGSRTPGIAGAGPVARPVAGTVSVVSGRGVSAREAVGLAPRRGLLKVLGAAKRSQREQRDGGDGDGLHDLGPPFTS